MIVHVGEKSHNKLAIHPIRDTTVAGNRLAKVLDLKSPLESRGKETTKWCNQRSERRENQNMKLNRLDPECRTNSEPIGDVVWLRDKRRVWRALQPGQNVGTEIIDGANEIFVAHEDIGHEIAETNGANPGAQESFDCLFGGQFNQLCTAKGNSANVGKYIVRDHQGGRQEEPDHTFQDVVHNKVRLDDDQIERHMGPCELSELEAVVALLQRPDEENETWTHFK